jgi:catechol 2,3-dioxygenase-like lactoylglutathione lyase family enzyme
MSHLSRRKFVGILLYTAPMQEQRGRVIGIGGIFFKSANTEGLCRWYQQLGIDAGEHGATFPWRSQTDPSKEHVTVWSVFPSTSDYFEPSTAGFMINYIVEDLDALLARLGENGVRIDPKREDHEYGRFAWIYDPDGNKIELWEPPPAIA